MTREGAPDGNTNAITHGAFSKAASEQPERRGRLAELSEQVENREGLIDLLEDRAVRAVMICEVIESYVITQKQSGIRLDDIPVLKALPAFMNTAQRAINSLLDRLPTANSGQSEELKHILEVIEKHDKNAE